MAIQVLSYGISALFHFVMLLALALLFHLPIAFAIASLPIGLLAPVVWEKLEQRWPQSRVALLAKRSEQSLVWKLLRGVVAAVGATLLLLVALMLLGFGPAGEVLFGLAYCLDGYGPCGSKT